MIIIEFGGNTLQQSEKPANDGSQAEAVDGLASPVSIRQLPVYPRYGNPFGGLRTWIEDHILKPKAFRNP
ncbi:MAG: hypothetical protein ACOYYS_00795 [Chloroflexota bacterium]